MWAAKDNGNDINWTEAKSYCENYRGGDYTDWRMPTQEELAGLYDEAKTFKPNCGIDVHLTKLIRLTCCFIWASQMRRDTEMGDYFFFGRGDRSWRSQSSIYSIRALPVRFTK
jgi:hypothetical protein